jgi:dTDP-4-amino-4,6-dideoxygalactose transaminase
VLVDGVPRPADRLVDGGAGPTGRGPTGSGGASWLTVGRGWLIDRPDQRVERGVVADFLPHRPTGTRPEDQALLRELVREIGGAADERFVLGRHTELFELLLAESTGATAAIACGSAGAALTMLLRALRIGPGDEVIVPAFGSTATVSAVLAVDARPVFADIDPMSLTMDPAEAEQLITPRTRALLPAHEFAVLADLPAFVGLAAQYGLRLVENAAVALGGTLHGRPAGGWGEAGIVSVGPGTVLDLPGDGGAALCRDPRLAAVLREMRESRRGPFVPQHSRFDEILAAFGNHRFPGLTARIARRAAIADHYTDRLAGLPGLQTPPPNPAGRCPHAYPVLAQRRDQLADHLAAQGIGTRVPAPGPLPATPPFARYAEPAGHWPHATAAAAGVLTLPLHAALTDGQADRVADAVAAFASTFVGTPA